MIWLPTGERNRINVQWIRGRPPGLREHWWRGANGRGRRRELRRLEVDVFDLALLLAEQGLLIFFVALLHLLIGDGGLLQEILQRSLEGVGRDLLVALGVFILDLGGWSAQVRREQFLDSLERDVIASDLHEIGLHDIALRQAVADAVEGGEIKPPVGSKHIERFQLFLNLLVGRADAELAPLFAEDHQVQGKIERHLLVETAAHERGGEIDHPEITGEPKVAIELLHGIGVVAFAIDLERGAAAGRPALAVGILVVEEDECDDREDRDDEHEPVLVLAEKF